MSGFLSAFIILFSLIMVVFSTFIMLFILALYYSVFKRARVYHKVKRELKRVRKERDRVLAQ
ncbi:hypothetical protein MCW_01282 [Cardidatus Bartonella washoeensis 085-0475]|uniref:Uncharacterized protein n=1 Tax=Cardidatus Bartonella washoeensis 085-0475 TaxID=1094564 RepID=J0Z7P8_9HYPH|nr:hypothetical protein MCW_01282 [Bartonella washoeensis 085-0475]